MRASCSSNFPAYLTKLRPLSFCLKFSISVARIHASSRDVMKRGGTINEQALSCTHALIDLASYWISECGGEERLLAYCCTEIVKRCGPATVAREGYEVASDKSCPIQIDWILLKKPRSSGLGNVGKYRMSVSTNFPRWKWTARRWNKSTQRLRQVIKGGCSLGVKTTERDTHLQNFLRSLFVMKLQFSLQNGQRSGHTHMTSSRPHDVPSFDKDILHIEHR